MMAPWVYQEVRAEAAIHIQLFREAGGPPVGAETSVRILGRIARIFRDDTAALRPGQKIAFTVPVINPFAKAGCSPGSTIYHNWERLSRTRWLEGFFEWDGELHLVHSQLAPILEPTEEPVCRPEEEGFLCAGNI
jgi:hypothetical protein